MTKLLLLLLLTSYCFGQTDKKNQNPAQNTTTMKQLRSGQMDTAQIVFINEGLRSGLFRLNKSDHYSLDDSSMILRAGNNRYERIYTEVLPEYFGANPNDTLDDGYAIQKALNIATKKGLKIVFSEGSYYTSIPLIPKVVIPAPVYGYKLTLEGAGSGLTHIIAKKNNTIFSFIQGQTSFIGRESEVLIQNIHFDANTVAPYCIKVNHVAGFKLIDCKFTGATQSNLIIGSDKSENYGIDIIRCYSLGNSVDDSHNNAGIELYNARYVYIDRFTTDGSKYGIYMEGCDKSFITNCHLEGSKTASIHIGKGGGEHKISNNMFMPYVLYETSAKFDGKIEALHIEGTQGGGAANIIYGNICIVPNPTSLPFKSVINQANGSLRAHPTFIVTGQDSKATGNLIGYNTLSKKVLVQVISGKFKVGETIRQSVTNGVGRIGEIIQPTSTGISFSGSSHSNIISNNQIRLNPAIGIYIDGENAIISNNSIEAVTAIYKNAQFATVIGNHLNSLGNIALKNKNGNLEGFANHYIGSVEGVYNEYRSETKPDNPKISNANHDILDLKGATVWLGNKGSLDTAKNLGISPLGHILLPNLPKSPVNLPSGTLWVDNKNILKVVP